MLTNRGTPLRSFADQAKASDKDDNNSVSSAPCSPLTKASRVSLLESTRLSPCLASSAVVLYFQLAGALSSTTTAHHSPSSYLPYSDMLNKPVHSACSLKVSFTSLQEGYY
ncbi:hypothetical protein V2J09_013100 [Rumex salicifolius]